MLVLRFIDVVTILAKAFACVRHSFLVLLDSVQAGAFPFDFCIRHRPTALDTSQLREKRREEREEKGRKANLSIDTDL